MAAAWRRAVDMFPVSFHVPGVSAAPEGEVQAKSSIASKQPITNTEKPHNACLFIWISSFPSIFFSMWICGGCPAAWGIQFSNNNPKNGAATSIGAMPLMRCVF
jgi:hypothetical protein